MTSTPPELAPRLTPAFGVAPLALTGPALEPVVPLALLEATRALDLPSTDLEIELVHELRNKRFGLSETVYMQIKRYSEHVRRQQKVAYDEVLALARLVGRRPDADLLFRDAGRRVARAALETVGGTTRRAARGLPRPIGRPLALRQLRALVRRFLGGRVERQGATLLFELEAPVTADAAGEGVGCGFVEAAAHELLLGLTGVEHVIQTVACRTRGDRTCQWRTDWRR